MAETTITVVALCLNSHLHPLLPTCRWRPPRPVAASPPSGWVDLFISHLFFLHSHRFVCLGDGGSASLLSSSPAFRGHFGYWFQEDRLRSGGEFAVPGPFPTLHLRLRARCRAALRRRARWGFLVLLFIFLPLLLLLFGSVPFVLFGFAVSLCVPTV